MRIAPSHINLSITYYDRSQFVMICNHKLKERVITEIFYTDKQGDRHTIIIIRESSVNNIV